MDRRSLLMTILTVTAGMAVWNMFFGNKKNVRSSRTVDVVSGAFIDETLESIRQPRVRNIDFDDETIPEEEEVITLENDVARVFISSLGGAIKRVESKKYTAVDGAPMAFLDIDTNSDREAMLGLIAFEEMTPLGYSLKKVIKDGAESVEAEFEGRRWRIIKRFSLESGRHVVKLEYEVTPAGARKDGDRYAVRITVPAPNMPMVTGEEMKAVVSEPNRVREIPSGKELSGMWARPALIGAVTERAVSCSVDAANNFVLGYFMEVNGRPVAMLETPLRTERLRGSVKIYVGPKQLKDVRGISRELEKLVGSGFSKKIASFVMETADKIKDRFGLDLSIAIILALLLIALIGGALFSIAMWRQKIVEAKALEYQEKFKRIQQLYAHDKQRYEEELRKLSGGVSMLEMLLIAIGGFVVGITLINAIREVARSPLVIGRGVLWMKDFTRPDPYYIGPLLLFLVTLILALNGGGAPKNMRMSGVTRRNVELKSIVLRIGISLIFLGFTIRMPSILMIFIVMQSYSMLAISFVARKLFGRKKTA